MNIINFSIDIIGDGSTRSLIEEKISEYSLVNHIRLLGVKNRDYIYNNLNNYNCFVLTSTSEGFGLTLAEAAIARLPILTSDLEGPMEVLSNGRFCTTFKCGDYRDLSSKMKTFIEKGSDLENIDLAFSYVKSHFEIRAVVDQYQNHYNNMLK